MEINSNGCFPGRHVLVGLSNQGWYCLQGDCMNIPLLFTPLKFNMEPKNQTLEKEIPFGNHHFQVPCLTSGVYCV